MPYGKQPQQRKPIELAVNFKNHERRPTILYPGKH